MATSAIPDVITALVAAAKAALSTVTVYDGFGVSEDPGDFLMVGVDDPDRPDAAFAGSSRQGWATTGAQGARDEEGDITCAALSWNGNGDQQSARTAAFATCAAVETLLRTNPTLGVSSLLWTSYGTDTQLSQSQDNNGALALVVFRVAFRARL